MLLCLSEANMVAVGAAAAAEPRFVAAPIFRAVFGSSGFMGDAGGNDRDDDEDDEDDAA